jgi:hypothetical protein
MERCQGRYCPSSEQAVNARPPPRAPRRGLRRPARRTDCAPLRSFAATHASVRGRGDGQAARTVSSRNPATAKRCRRRRRPWRPVVPVPAQCESGSRRSRSSARLSIIIRTGAGTGLPPPSARRKLTGRGNAVSGKTGVRSLVIHLSCSGQNFRDWRPTDRPLQCRSSR